MKLDKNVLKALIVETLQEVDSERTGTASPDVSAGMDSEPTPEELAPLSQKKAQSAMPEDVKAVLDNVDRVQKELADIKKTLEDLMKREERGED